MDLSLIIPCHNLENYISSLLESLKKQVINKYKVEYIFVLDDCTDNTEKVIKEFDLDNYFIVTCCVHSCGIARNIGLEQARGDYIWFIDGDDWLLENNFIDDILDILKSNHLNRIRMNHVCAQKIDYDIAVPIWQYIFSREFIGNIRFLRVQPNEDLYFLKEVYRKENLLDINNDCYLFDTNRIIYYYNYGRENSNMYQIKNKGKINY